MTNRNKSILLIIISAFGFSLMILFVKLSGYVPTLQKTIFRNGVTMIITFFLVIYFKQRLLGKRENQPLLLLRSVLGGIGIILLFYSIDHLVIADADIINKMSPFFTILFAAFISSLYRYRLSLNVYNSFLWLPVYENVFGGISNSYCEID